MEDLRIGETSEEVVWTEGAVTWELGELGSGSEDGRQLTAFLCFDLGEG